MIKRRPEVDIDVGLGRRFYDNLIRDYHAGFVRGEHGLPRPPRAWCHNDRPVFAHHICRACYTKWWRRSKELERETDIKFGHLVVVERDV